MSVVLSINVHPKLSGYDSITAISKLIAEPIDHRQLALYKGLPTHSSSKLF